MSKPVTWSALDICNRALLRLGQGKVADITSSATTTAGQYCYEFYDQCRYMLLSRFPWKFATAKINMRLTAETDAQWSYVYELPGDCIRPLIIDEDPTIAFQVQGLRVFCDQGEAQLTYIFDADEPGDFDPLFSDCLSKFIAAELAMPLTGLPQVQEQMASYAEAAYRAACGADARSSRDSITVTNSIANARL